MAQTPSIDWLCAAGTAVVAGVAPNSVDARSTLPSSNCASRTAQPVGFWRAWLPVIRTCLPVREHLLRQAVAGEHAARRELAMPDRFLAVGARDAQIDERMRIDELKLGDGAVDRDLLLSS